MGGQPAWYSREGRSENVKFVSWASSREAFKAGAVDSGWLPPGVVRAGATSRGDFAVMIIPAGRHDLPVERQKGTGIETLRVKLPALAFFGVGKTYFAWALKDPAAAGGAALFKAPLPNVFDGGRICWGSNTPPQATGQNVAQAWALFLNAPFNGHAASGKAKGHKGDVRPLLRGLARSGEAFPNDLLLTDDKATLGDAVEREIGGTQ